MSNLSELLPAGAGAKSADFVASGTLGSGVTVALKSDGTVEAVALTSASAGTPVVFSSADPATNITSTYDPDANKIIIAYKGSSNYGNAIVGTVSGTSISFGTPVVFQSSTISEPGSTYDIANQKVIIAYTNNLSIAYGKAIVGTVSGTSISFGTAVTFGTSTSSEIEAVYDSTNQKVVVTYTDWGNNYYGTSKVGTVSGTSISFGTASIFVSSNFPGGQSAYDSSSGKVVIAYRLTSNGYGTAVVGTVSGTSISFGSPVTFETVSTSYYSITYDTSNSKVVIAYRYNSGATFQGRAIVGTVSGTSISFGTAVVYLSTRTDDMSISYDSNASKVVIAYMDVNNSNRGALVVGTVSGTSISFGSPVVFESDYTYAIFSAYDSGNNKTVISYTSYNGVSSSGKSVVFQNASSNNTDFIGITDQAIANTATGAVIVQGGVSEKLSGLTVGADYYVQDDGSLASGSIPFDISGASYDSVSFSAVSQMSNGLSEMAFGDSGNKLYIIRDGIGVVYQYNMTTAYDISTASYASKSYNAGAQDSFSSGLAFNNDGTKLYTLGRDVADAVYQHTLSTAWDVSTATYDSVSFIVGSQTGLPFGVIFNGDGTKMYITGFDNDSVYQYALSSAFDLSTASYASKSLSVSSQDGSPRSLALNADGTKLFINGADNDAVFQYNLSTPYDLATGSYSSISFSVSSQSTTPNALLFNDSGTKMFIGQAGLNSIVYQYSTTAASTTVPAGRALSSTSILLEG